MNDLQLGREQDLAAIRRLVEQAEEHQSDPDRFIPLHTPDATVVNFGGRYVGDRETLARAMAEALASPLASVATRTEIHGIRFLGADVAIVACVKHVFDDRDPGLRDGTDSRLPARTGRLTYVVVKRSEAGDGTPGAGHRDGGATSGGTWLISSAQTTPVLR
ncbi:YybH family protein [Kitasatospora sp. NPDC059327]|uniref:YybH family protein n=1 Tax=Kitasatospora sp. NPDC059327 TaxID=3346803 RepID=UPI0036BE530B